jgi:hypothetical protein
MMIAAGKEMSELVGEENREKSEGKGEAGSEAKRVFVKESERAEEFVERERLILRIGRGELRAGDEAGTKREEEEDAREEQHFSGRAVGDGGVANAAGRDGAPIDVGRDGWRRIFWERWGHGMFCA